jgi:uridine nucleosidase
MSATFRPPLPRGDRPLKVIIDTDPGIDDTYAILLALRSPEIEVVGVTSLYGNVHTKMATRNALYVLEKFGRPDIPVYEGHHTSIVGASKERIADFVHGADGFGNTNQPPPTTEMVRGKTAAEFIVETANRHPGEVTVVALASATNVTLALRADPTAVVENLRAIVHLGGAFFVNGNVNPSAEANVFGDPDAADELYGSGANVTVVGLDVTQRLMFTKEDVESLGGGGAKNDVANDPAPGPGSPPSRAKASAPSKLADSPASPDPAGSFLRDISAFYMRFHVDTIGVEGIYMHDPAAVLLAFRPDLFGVASGAVRVGVDGLCRGQTVMDQGKKRWTFANAWTGEGRDRPRITVALDVDVEKVMGVFRERFRVGGGGGEDGGGGGRARMAGDGRVARVARAAARGVAAAAAALREGAEEAYRAFGNARRADAMTAMVILGAMTAGVCSSLVDRRWGARR